MLQKSEKVPQLRLFHGEKATRGYPRNFLKSKLVFQSLYYELKTFCFYSGNGIVVSYNFSKLPPPQYILPIFYHLLPYFSTGSIISPLQNQEIMRKSGKIWYPSREERLLRLNVPAITNFKHIFLFSRAQKARFTRVISNAF